MLDLILVEPSVEPTAARVPRAVTDHHESNTHTLTYTHTLTNFRPLIPYPILHAHCTHPSPVSDFLPAAASFSPYQVSLPPKNSHLVNKVPICSSVKQCLPSPVMPKQLAAYKMAAG